MKNFPKKVDSKTRYLRIEIPENLDLVLEGLIRKVLREQPDMDNIYSFAAEYFETLLKIRDQAGIKHTSNQICPSSNDEDALQMIKLANTFQKPVTEKLFPLKNSTENKKLETSERKVLKVLPNGKENLDKKSSNYKSKGPTDSATSIKKSKINPESMEKIYNENFPLELKESEASDQRISRNDQHGETVIKNKEQVMTLGEEKNEKLQEEPALNSAEVNEDVKAKPNKKILNGVVETSQVIEKSLDSAEEDDLKEKTENVIEDKNREDKEHENTDKTKDFIENKEDEVSNLEKNSGNEEKKEEKSKESQLNEETSSANRGNKPNKKNSFLKENKDIKGKDEKEVKTSNEETNENGDMKDKKENTVNSLEEKKSEEIKVEEEKDVRKNNDLDECKSTTSPGDNESENKLIEQTLASKKAEHILNVELVPSKASESILSKEKVDVQEKSENKKENEETNFLHNENKLKIPNLSTNETKDVLLTNNELTSSLSKEQDKLRLDEQHPSIKQLDISASDTKTDLKEREINRGETALKESEKEEKITSCSQKEKTEKGSAESQAVEAKEIDENKKIEKIEEGNTDSGMMVAKEIDENKKLEDKNFEFLNLNEADIAKTKSDIDVRLPSKTETVEKTKSDSLNLEDSISKNNKGNFEKKDEELMVENEADNDIEPPSGGEDITRADDENDSDIRKKSFFKTLTDSLKEVDDGKLEVSIQDNSVQEVISTATEEQILKKEEDIEVLNNSSKPENQNSEETSVIIKIENEKETKPKEENLNKGNNSKITEGNNDQKEEKKIGSHVHYDSPLNQNTEEVDKIEKNDVEDEELCTVVDALVLSKLKEKEGNDNTKSNNEENNEKTESLAERKIKTIETHYYDLLKVPETVTKEYRVHRTKEEFPQTLANENERKLEISEEEKVKKEMISEVLAEEKPNVENKIFLFDSTRHLEEIHLHDPLRANEIFLSREKHYSSIEKIIFSTTEKENGEDKRVVNEIVEKRSAFEAGAVPLAPRGEEDLNSQHLQALEEAKEKKYDKSNSSTEESESNKNESNASISAESKSLDIDTPITSVDVKTVVQEQVKEECDEEEKVEMLEGTGASSAPESAAKKLLRVDEIESDEKDTNERTKIETKKLNRSSSQSLMNAEGFTKKKLLKKTNSMPTIRQESTDEEIWSTIERELENAATKIQSKFRGYSTRKKLRREDAVQITTEEPSNSVTSAEEGGCQGTGEFHDSIVLSVHPR